MFETIWNFFNSSRTARGPVPRKTSLAPFVAGVGTIGVAIAILAPAATASKPESPPDAAVRAALETPFSADTTDWRIEINLPERVLRVYRRSASSGLDADWSLWRSCSVAIGMRRYPTPVFSGRLGRAIVRPDWAAPNEPWAGEFAGTVVRFRHPENPFRIRNESGAWEGYFLPLGRFGIGLHTTNKPSSVGRLASHGCIRMRLSDIRWLIRDVPTGTPTTTVYRLYEARKQGDSVLVRVFPDVYRKLRRERRLEHLAEALRPFRMVPNELPAETVERLMHEGEVVLGPVSPASHSAVLSPIPTPANHAQLQYIEYSLLSAVHDHR